MNDLKQFYPQLDTWLAQGRKIAIATVTQTWGSSPRQVGAKLAVTDQLEILGSVSAGCVENAVIEEALTLFRKGISKHLRYDIGQESAWEFGLACGGKLSVWLEPYSSDFHQAIRPLLQADVRFEVHHVLDGKELGKTWVTVDGEICYGTMPSALSTHLPQQTAIYQAEDEASIFVEHITPPLRLMVIGAGHISLALDRLAQVMGYPLTVIDPRTAFLTEERFPNALRLPMWSKEALALQPIQAHHAVILLTHDPKIDDPVLESALQSESFYIGALGSKATHHARLERMKAKGYSDEALTRIHAPVGLSIGAKTPEEIALAILAEIVACYRA